MITQKDKIQLIRRSILDSMAAIESLQKKMFHEILPEVDREFHEIIGQDYIRLRALDVNLKHYIDDLNFDGPSVSKLSKKGL